MEQIKSPTIRQTLAQPENYRGIKRLYKACQYPYKMEKNDRIAISTEEGGKIIAALRLQQKPEGWIFLRGLVVDRQYRRKGVASKILEHCIENVFMDQKAYCFVDRSLSLLYEKVDFKPETTDGAPAFIKDQLAKYSKRNKQLIFMRKEI